MPRTLSGSKVVGFQAILEAVAESDLVCNVSTAAYDDDWPMFETANIV